MATHTITLDEVTEASLQSLSAKEGQQASEYAARLLARAVRAARRRPVYDSVLLKAYAAENAAEEEALSNSDPEHHLALLTAEEAPSGRLKLW